MEEKMKQFEAYLSTIFAQTELPLSLRQAMEYSLFSEGKRIRPMLAIATATLNEKQKIETIFPIAAAIEMVHTYSLIHDDLPAMDDDDMRRGKPSNHKQFGEGLAILAGDALLSHSFYVLQQTPVTAGCLLEINKMFSLSIGLGGMVTGQVLDIALENDKDAIHYKLLEDIQRLKTGKLIECSILASAKALDFETNLVEHLTTFSIQLGKLFQIVDDYLDDEPSTGKTVGIDVLNNKPTYLTLLGKDYLKKYIKEVTAICENELKAVAALGYNVTAFRDIVAIILRKI